MKYDFSIIIPVYNRLKELECCLLCLMRQDFHGLFEVIVCDDGSINDTISLVRKFDEEGMDIKYIWQPDRGFRAGHARNKGAAIAKGEHLIFLDSDIIVEKTWLSEYSRIYRETKCGIICGRYDFLLPMIYTVNDVMDNFSKVVSNQLELLEVPKNQFFGADMRMEMFAKGEVKQESGGPLFGGNVLISKHIFESVGGFDENIILHGGEDACLGLALEQAGWQFVYSSGPMGWHLYHYRDQIKNEQSLLRNVDYIDRKFHKGKYEDKN